MTTRIPLPVHYGLTIVLLLAGVGLTQAQSNRPAAAGPDALVRQVRAALAHGSVDDAKTIASGTAGTPAARELSQALIEVFQGTDDAARKRLQTLVDGGGSREASLELALLEQRHGQRQAAARRLQPLTTQLSLNTPDDYFFLARAARAAGDKQLANAAYNRIEKSGRAEVYAERGDLFLQDHQNGEAATEFRDALQADPKWVPAHLGMARAFAEQDPEVAAAAFDAAKDIAPDHPAVLLLAAERALAADDFAAASTALDRVAQVKPGEIKEAALRAALAYGERRLPEVDAAILKVREIDPTSAHGFRAAAEEAARKYRFQDAADYARKGVALDPEDPAGWAELGLYLLRTGDETEARTALESSWTRDKSDAVTKNLLDLMDSLDNFTVVPDGDLIFKFPKDQAAVLKPYALPLGREAMKTFTARYGFTPQGPILVEIFAKHDDFAVRTVGLMGLTGALGACFGRVVTMDSPKARRPGDFSWQATEWHELAHVFTLQLSQYRVPRWLTEGISVFEEHRRVAAWGRELTVEFARNLARGKTFGVKKLPDAFKHPETLSMAYFEASLVVEQLVALHGDAGLRTLLKAYADGATDAEAFAKAFGQSVDDADKAFAAFVQERYGAMGKALADPAPADQKDLASLKARADRAPENFSSQFAYGRAAFEAGDTTAARSALEKAAALAPVDGDGSPRGLLAEIAEKAGDTAKARAELRALLAHDHENVGAARRLATLALNANATDDADFALRLVADLDPFDANVHAALGKREMARGRVDAAIIEFQAALALNPATLAEAHTDLGEALLAANRKEEARKEAVAAMLAAPGFARAQDLMLAASRK